MTQAYPLQWPAAHARTPVECRKASAFRVTQDKAQRNLVAEIGRLGGRDATISTNLPIRRDGLPYADIARRHIPDQGVAVYFSYNGLTTCFACDRWATIGENMHAIALTIKALRGIERWGSGDMMQRAFNGFSALPPPLVTPAGRSWWDVLEVSQNATREICEAQYRQLAKARQADHDAMVELNAAIEQERKARPA